MEKPLRILVVEDSESDAELLLRALRRHGYDPVYERVDTHEAMAQALARQTWDIIISDYAMPRFSGLDALKLVQDKGLDLPFIIVSGAIGEDIAVGAMKQGAHDYIMKNNTARLMPAIERELKEAQARREHRQAQEQIKLLAYHDPITGLPNRAQLLERLQQAAVESKRNKTPFALLLLDLDHFREFNDTLGHANGDEILRETAHRLQQVMRLSDMTVRLNIVARLGGDEFALLLFPADAGYAHQIADTALNALETPFEVPGFTLNMGAKIGIALFPEHAADAYLLLQHADVALSLAKLSHQDYFIYEVVSDPSNPQRLMLMGDLRNAVDHDQLFPHFQPKICLHTGRVTGVEALARWKHPERGPIPPDEFIPLAEKANIIGPLAMSILKTSMAQCQAWCRKGRNIPVAVNLSAKNLLDRTLVKKVGALLSVQGMEPNLLEFEITESALMEDPANALDILMAFREMGIALYIDDFGIGYSSLAYLKKLPINAIKIDKAFVMDMTINSDSAIIVRSTIALAHNLGLKVVAEGVEDKATLEELAALGCDQAQGYHISRPLPADGLDEWLSKASSR